MLRDLKVRRSVDLDISVYLKEERLKVSGSSGDYKSWTSLPRLRFDKVALRVIAGVCEGLSGAVPNGVCVVFTVTAPIREPAKTTAAIVLLGRAMLPPGTNAESAETVHGNSVRLRVVRMATERTVKVAGFVHNPEPPPDALLDLAQALAQGATDVSEHGRQIESVAKAAEHHETLHRMREQLLGSGV